MFTIYPPLNDHDWIAWDQLHAGFPVHTIPAGWAESRAKHFTDAELAAEVWQATSEFNERMHSPRRNGKTRTAEVAMTFRRFATRPHALEDS